jgi:predicted Zn-dependent peptidase
MAVAIPDPAAPLYFPTTLTNSLLGGTFTSRITTNLREDKGYSYSPGSSISARRGDALWIMAAEITAQHTAAGLTEIFREIERLQREPPATEELDAIKRYRAGLFVIGNSSPDGVLGQLAFMDLHGLPPEFLTHWVANVYAVTPQQVTNIAQRYIVPARMTIVIVGDLKGIGESVRALPQLQGAHMP